MPAGMRKPGRERTTDPGQSPLRTAPGSRTTTSLVASHMGGRTVVFLAGIPVWMLVYYGWVDKSADPAKLYAVLKNALKRMPAEAPYRGPGRYEEDPFVYANTWEGALERFSGREEILEGSSLVYRADYAGGWVDKREAV